MSCAKPTRGAGRRSTSWAIPAAVRPRWRSLPNIRTGWSLALLEPAWAGNWDWSPAYAGSRKKYGQLEELPPEHLMPAFSVLPPKLNF